ncbi:NAD-binding protein [Terricaulis sp.]|uniref:NAD-binding protein n=1 Tax=Terricaulis sp. TaxID=2768686 RepID=UPI0037830E80
MTSRIYANFWSHAASELTAVSHTRASVWRWLIIVLLVAVWFGLGMWFWLSEYGFSEAFYRTVGAVSMWDEYFAKDLHGEPRLELQIVRFAALMVPLVSLVFAFSGQLGSSLARLFNLGATRHVVIAGDSPAALSLARDCVDRYRDAVIMIAQDLPDETKLGLRRKGVIVLEGDATNPETLKTARANFASHVVAFEADDTSNLQIEAAVRRLVGDAKRRPPIGVHVATRSPMLLKESREMRSTQMRQKKAHPSIDPKPFSLDEMAARALIQSESQTMLSLAQQLGQERVHVVFFGFCEAGEAVAGYLLKTMWSAHFAAPRITVLSPDPDASRGRFNSRHREAFAHPDLWSADIEFLKFDWDTSAIGPELLAMVETARGKPTAIVVSTGADPGNIHLSIALKRACNHQARWPVPIFMKETSQSEFSREYARGDETPELDAYLQAFGGHQITATRAKILDGELDRGAAIAHEHYSNDIAAKGQMSMKELQAAMSDWSEVLETYRAANRAVSDSALVKMWDAGWAPAPKKSKTKGETAPAIPAELMPKLAQREHDRWIAERLMSGWRPTGDGEKRDNDLMAHDKLVAWSALGEGDREKDAVQVRAAVDIARLMYPQGFVARG